MTIDEAKKIIKSECYIANLLNLDRTRMVNTALDLAIKALEQQPCDDCISRQAVLDIINFEDEWLFDAKSHNADTKIVFSGLESRVKALPSVTPKTGWIPVSERESKYPCLACDKYGQIFIPIGVVTIDGHSYDGLHFEFDAEKFLKGHPREIMAWMPLPQPYKAESEEEE